MDTHSPLRNAIARLEGRDTASLPGDVAVPCGFGIPAVDGVLGGGLARGQLHEFAGPAAAGLALVLAAGAGTGPVVWAATGMALHAAGFPYAQGIEALGIDPARLILVQAGRPEEALWAVEEALKCRGVPAVILELPEADRAADLTATRRLSLTARDGGGLALLVRHRPTLMASAAATRWTAVPVPGPADGLGGLGPAALALHLTKNRRGACGHWTLVWNSHDQRFTLAAASVAVAAPAFDRSYRARA